MITSQQKTTIVEFGKLLDNVADHIHSIVRHAESDKDYHMDNEDVMSLINEVCSEVVLKKEEIIGLLKGGVREKIIV